MRLTWGFKESVKTCWLISHGYKKVGGCSLWLGQLATLFTGIGKAGWGCEALRRWAWSSAVIHPENISQRNSPMLNLLSKGVDMEMKVMEMNNKNTWNNNLVTGENIRRKYREESKRKINAILLCIIEAEERRGIKKKAINNTIHYLSISVIYPWCLIYIMILFDINVADVMM